MDDVKRLCDRLEASAIVASPLGRAAMREAATALTLAQARIRELETALAARSAEPVAGPSYVVNCCNCGRIIDTREKDEGGDGFGAELSDERWVCSPECWDAVVEPTHPKEAPDV